MKKGYWVGVLLAAVIFLAVLVIDRSEEGEPIREPSPEQQDPVGPGNVSDYDDPPGLTAHQLALNRLYVEIPYEKEDVRLTKRTTDSHVFVDVQDKDTGEVRYSYGESLGSGNERQVVRDFPSKEGTVRLQMLVAIDSAEAMIEKVISSSADYDPMPEQVENEMISTGSRSGEYPAELVEILASLHLKWGDERENLYEGYVIGVIGE